MPLSTRSTSRPHRSGATRCRIAIAIAVLALGAFGDAGDAAAQSTPTADYTVVFDATWSLGSHPLEFPPNPHFSPLIGSTHDADAHYWGPGEIAPNAIEDVAETGGPGQFTALTNTFIAAGDALALISGGSISRSPGSSQASFTADEDFPLLTLVSMVAPSPDWFVGVHDYDLIENGEWIEGATIQMQVYDAGTDSGITYRADNEDTQPRDPISACPAPFFTTQPCVVGTFTITRTDSPPATPVGPLAPWLAGFGILVLGAHGLRRRR